MSNRTLRVPTAALACCLVVLGSTPGTGIAAAKGTVRDAQTTLAERFDAGIDAKDLDSWLKRMSAGPNHVGAPNNIANAEYTRDQFRSWGWDARIETFDVLYPTLKRHALQLVAPARYTASLAEPPVPGDESTNQVAESLPPYHAYGGDGDAEAELVYVNYGMPADYEELARHGIEVRGRIVIARYGAGWRGLKPKLAQEHGAIGCIVYSDPADDGFGQGDVYPKGTYRPAFGVQRGSVADMPVHPGDPLTPGYGSVEGAKRLSLADAKTLLKIPVLPISYADAQPLLSAIEGTVAPPSWRGALPITYHIGPGPARVHLVVESNWNQAKAYNVIATLKGAELPDQWVMRGNHRDGWVFGASDPLSSHVAMMAEAKSLGALARSGWKPRRTLVYASWDAEEPGLLGSTEWVETHAGELARKVVLYINTDGNARGFLDIEGSHPYQQLANEVARAVSDPQTSKSVSDRLQAARMTRGYAQDASADQKLDLERALAGADFRIAALGSGSDFTPFLQHLGLATLNVGYYGEGDANGVYHSAYDTYAHYTRFVDPGLRYGVALAKTAGRLVLGVSEADVLPMRFAPMAEAVAGYVAEVHQLVAASRERSVLLARLRERDAFGLASDPTAPTLAPPAQSAVPHLNLAPLDNANTRLQAAAKAYDRALSIIGTANLSADSRRQLDALLQGMEQSLLDPEGLPGRSWYRHLIYAPGLYTGYGVKTLPGVREAIELRDWAQAERYAVKTAEVLDRYAARLDQARVLLEPTAR